jgi:hypothetical protein
MADSLEIHPGIGIARLGTSDEFFLAPEPDTAPPEKYRDATGSLKRQAARFRVFFCDRDANGQLRSARELTAADGEITWTVHLVNRKGSAPNFAKPSGGRRNHATGNDAQDAALIIDPGPRQVKGVSAVPAFFDSGAFKATAVPLGDIRTDERGRLLVCGGRGTSDSVPPQPNPNLPIEGFADSNGWFDDTSDGSVTATVKLSNGTTVTPAPAWVIVGPPDFAPAIKNLVTLYDVARDVAVREGKLAMPDKPSFVRDIQPILDRASGYQWVNRFAAGGHSGARPGNFAHDWTALADPANPPAEAQTVLRRLRDATQTPVPAPAEPNARRWMPRLHDENNDANVLPLTALQYTMLQKWAAGHFIGDLQTPPPADLLPDALDRAALESCSGGAFFPGIEVGLLMKRPETYSAPFRVDAAALVPGQLTAGNALPWQADFHACTWEMAGFIGWWPSQRPDHVRPEDNPTVFKDWARGISGVLDDSDRDMIDGWHRLGIVRERTTSSGTVFVETERDPTLS